MKIQFVVFAGCFVLLALASCGSNENGEPSRHDTQTVESTETNATSPGDKTESIRGQFVFGHEVRSLTPCNQAESLWVIDQTGLLANLHGELAPQTKPYSDIFVAVMGRIGPKPQDGFGADYSGSVTVEEVVYAAFEGFDCDFDWNRFVYRAQGNEPFWMIEVRQEEMRLTRLGHDDITWTNFKENRTDDAAIFHAIGDGQSTVQLVVENKSSRDTMSGAYYGLSARLILDGESFTGYALRGSDAHDLQSSE
jgi:putative lipoprotein